MCIPPNSYTTVKPIERPRGRSHWPVWWRPRTSRVLALARLHLAALYVKRGLAPLSRGGSAQSSVQRLVPRAQIDMACTMCISPLCSVAQCECPYEMGPGRSVQTSSQSLWSNCLRSRLCGPVPFIVEIAVQFPSQSTLWASFLHN